LKEEFRHWFNRPLDRATAAVQLADWLQRVVTSGLKALQAFTRTVRNWREHILNYFDGRHSNGFAEGVNLKIKLVNRRAFAICEPTIDQASFERQWMPHIAVI
jgi:transposase